MDEESSLWSPFVALNVSRDCTLGGLKKKLEDKFGVPAERQVLPLITILLTLQDSSQRRYHEGEGLPVDRQQCSFEN
jgi:hypothetical protein